MSEQTETKAASATVETKPETVETAPAEPEASETPEAAAQAETAEPTAEAAEPETPAAGAPDTETEEPAAEASAGEPEAQATASPEETPEAEEAPGAEESASADEPEEPHAGPAEVETRTSEEHTPTVEQAPAAEATEEAAAQDEDTETPAEAEAQAQAAATQEAPKDEEAQKAEAEAAEGEAASGEAAGETDEEPAEEELTEQDKVVIALREAKEEGTRVEGKVIGWNQGGFHVVVDGVTTFCPRSEMEIKNPKSPSFYMDKTFDFKVIKHQKRGRRIVLSRKQILLGKREDVVQSLETKAKTDEPIEGRVSSLTDFGAFVDVGGIEGLVHVTEISHTRVGHPKERLQVGQKVQVQVLKVEEGGDRISLSMKAMEPNPWKQFAESHPRGSKFQGKVVRKTDFGIFVELEPGFDGMIHVSQLPPGMTLEANTLDVGNEIEGWVLRTEPGRERISLSLREVPEEDPWKTIHERYPEGEVVEGEVEDVTNFGVFILLEPGLTGLLPNSYLNLPRGQDASRFFPAGKKVQVQVESVDAQRKRISLAQEGQRLEGGRADYKEYVKKQKKREPAGMTAMEAAFAKLRDQGQDQQEA